MALTLIFAGILIFTFVFVVVIVLALGFSEWVMKRILDEDH